MTPPPPPTLRAIAPAFSTVAADVIQRSLAPQHIVLLKLAVAAPVCFVATRRGVSASAVAQHAASHVILAVAFPTFTNARVKRPPLRYRAHTFVVSDPPAVGPPPQFPLAPTRPPPDTRAPCRPSASCDTAITAVLLYVARSQALSFSTWRPAAAGKPSPPTAKTVLEPARAAAPWSPPRNSRSACPGR